MFSAGPSENYWQALAETRRKALEKTLEENQQLHERLANVTEDNQRLQELLKDAQDIIDSFNEYLTDLNNESKEESPSPSPEGNNPPKGSGDKSPEHSSRRP